MLARRDVLRRLPRRVVFVAADDEVQAALESRVTISIAGVKDDVARNRVLDAACVLSCARLAGVRIRRRLGQPQARVSRAESDRDGAHARARPRRAPPADRRSGQATHRERWRRHAARRDRRARRDISARRARALRPPAGHRRAGQHVITDRRLQHRRTCGSHPRARRRRRRVQSARRRRLRGRSALRTTLRLLQKIDPGRADARPCRPARRRAGVHQPQVRPDGQHPDQGGCRSIRAAVHRSRGAASRARSRVRPRCRSRTLGSTRRSSEILESVVKASVSAIDQRDATSRPATPCASRRSRPESPRRSSAAGRGRYRDTHFTGKQMRELRFAALLHDFGKVTVQEDVLVKAKKLPPILWERVASRFDLIRVTMEREYYRQRARLRHSGDDDRLDGAHLEEELTAQLEQLERMRAIVRSANEPTVLARGVGRRADRTSRREPSRGATAACRPISRRTSCASSRSRAALSTTTSVPRSSRTRRRRTGS